MQGKDWTSGPRRHALLNVQGILKAPACFDLYKGTSFFQFLWIAPDTRLPQILVFKLFSARHICHILYPREYVLHVQGINVSDVHSENAFSLFSCIWTLA